MVVEPLCYFLKFRWANGFCWFYASCAIIVLNIMQTSGFISFSFLQFQFFRGNLSTLFMSYGCKSKQPNIQHILMWVCDFWVCFSALISIVSTRKMHVDERNAKNISCLKKECMRWSWSINNTPCPFSCSDEKNDIFLGKIVNWLHLSMAKLSWL